MLLLIVSLSGFLLARPWPCARAITNAARRVTPTCQLRVRIPHPNAMPPPSGRLHVGEAAPGARRQPPVPTLSPRLRGLPCAASFWTRDTATASARDGERRPYRSGTRRTDTTAERPLPQPKQRAHPAAKPTRRRWTTVTVGADRVPIVVLGTTAVLELRACPRRLSLLPRTAVQPRRFRRAVRCAVGDRRTAHPPRGQEWLRPLRGRCR